MTQVGSGGGGQTKHQFLVVKEGLRALLLVKMQQDAKSSTKLSSQPTDCEVSARLG